MELLERLAAKCGIIVILLGGCNSSVKHPFFSELKWYNEAFIFLQNDNGIFKQNGKPLTGIVYSLTTNQKDTLSVASFVEGKEHGEWRKYFNNGQMMERRFYTEGKKSGLFEAWWPDGKKRLLYHFVNGEYEGSCRDWDSTGLLVNDMHYSQGYENGEQKQFYENGKVKANYVMKDGRRYGLLGTKNCVNVSDSVFNK